jgi:O-Antigen ligase
VLSRMRLSRPVMLAGCALAAGIVFAVLNGERFITLALAGSLAAALLVWAVRRTMADPTWLIFALVLADTLPYSNLLPFNPHSRWWIYYPILISFCTPAIFGAWKSGIFKRGCLMGYTVFLGWAAVSVTYSLYPELSLSRVLRAALIFGAVSFIASQVRSAHDIQRILERYLAANAILVALNLIAAVAFPHRVAVDTGDGALPVGIFTWIQDASGFVRFSGFLGGPNEIGGLMPGTVCAGLALWHALSRRQRRTLVCIIAVSVVLAAMADSRTSFVALGAGLAGICVWEYRFRGFAACVFTVALLGATYNALGPTQKHYFNREVDTLTGRTTEWRFELRKLAERPLIGYGFSTEGAIFEDRYFPEWTAFSGGARESLQNGYLSVALGLGIPAFIFWLSIYLMPWVSLFRERIDPWGLKPLFFLLVFPGLVYAFSESGIAEPAGNLLPFLCWMLAERFRLATRATLRSERFNLRTASGAVNFQHLFAP